jgi:hypothetical protein
MVGCMLEDACESHRRYGMIGRDAYLRAHPNVTEEYEDYCGPSPRDAS